VQRKKEIREALDKEEAYVKEVFGTENMAEPPNFKQLKGGRWQVTVTVKPVSADMRRLRTLFEALKQSRINEMKIGGHPVIFDYVFREAEVCHLFR
jgi:hypothetical protein